MAENFVITMRHDSVFKADAFGGRRVSVIGCGASGSRIAISLAKLGISNIHLWDFDIVEAHNIANQAFGNDDVGKPKAQALAELIQRQTGLVVGVHNEKVTGETGGLGDVVFILTDTMASRKEIWEGALRYKPSVQTVIETRMGADNYRVYCVNPCEPDDIEFWEGTLYTDEESSESLCGSSVSVGPTAELLSGAAVWAFIRWFNWQDTASSADPKPRPERELLAYINPPFNMLRA